MKPSRTMDDAPDPRGAAFGSREARWILDNLIEGVARFDAQGMCIWANPAYLRIFGVTEPPDEPVPWDRHVHPEDQERVREAAHELSSAGRFERELRCYTIHGEPLVARFRVYAARPEEDSKAAFVVLVEDVTEWKEIEAALELRTQELERLNAELEQFAYIAAHDLQEPARKLLAFSSLLEKDLGSDLPEDASRDLGFITDAAQRLQSLVQDLLVLSRTTRNALRAESLPLDECVDAALSDLFFAVERRGARIDRTPLPQIVGDRTLLTQLYHNLIGNALKFCEEKPVISVEYEDTPEGRVFGVRDNGIGIDPKYADLIFQPFKRLHGRDAYEGTGMGLAICRKAVERHGGRLWVEPVPEGGTSFRFTLPGRRSS